MILGGNFKKVKFNFKIEFIFKDKYVLVYNYYIFGGIIILI